MRVNLFGDALPYIVKIASLLSWAVGAIGLLMLGGNPRVKLVVKSVPEHIKRRLAALKDGLEELGPAKVKSPAIEIREEALIRQESGTKSKMSYDQIRRPKPTHDSTTLSGHTLALSATPYTVSSTHVPSRPTIVLELVYRLYTVQEQGDCSSRVSFRKTDLT